MLLKKKTDNKLGGINQIAQVGEQCCPYQCGFIKTHIEEDKVGEVHNHGNSAAEILPEKLWCKGKLAEHLLFKKSARHKNQDKHEGFQGDKKGDPGEVVDPVVGLVKPGDCQSGKKHHKLYRRKDSLYFCPD